MATPRLTRDKIKADALKAEVMCTDSWNRQGGLLVELKPQVTTITATSYHQVLENLRNAIQNKQLCLPAQSNRGAKLLESFKW